MRAFTAGTFPHSMRLWSAFVFVNSGSVACVLQTSSSRSFSATKSDIALVAAIGATPDKAKYPYLARYCAHIASLTDAAKAK